MVHGTAILWFKSHIYLFLKGICVMRQAAKAIGGYYPTPDRVAAFLASWLVSSTGPGEIRALDPCCGTGRALDLVTQDLSPPLRTVGVELNRERAAEAQRILSRALHADVFKIRCTHQAFSLLFLNPPYDDDAGGRVPPACG
jgi:tRNA1(Val) A37 N6-methylase TrmN6